jgi:hypothetical protein
VDLNYLLDYQASETEFGHRYYPDYLGKRLNDSKYSKPYSFAVETANPSIWPQIPLNGTTLIKIAPTNKKDFEQFHSFSIKQIPELVRFAKETHKIQFILSDDADKYVNLEYLNPIFEELQPPLLMWEFMGTKPQITDLQKIRRNSEIEWETLIEVLDVTRPRVFHYPLLSQAAFAYWLSCLKREYLRLKVFGFEDLADEAMNNLLIDTNYAFKLISTSAHLFVQPGNFNKQIEPSFSLESIKNFNDIYPDTLSSSLHLKFPYEIGSFLMKKCTYYPESLDACKQVISLYKENDLYNVYNSFCDSINKNRINALIDRKEQLDEIFDNIWDESNKINRNKLIIEWGADVLIGTVGLFLEGYPGLLASIGFEIFDRTSSKFLSHFSEKIARKTVSPYSARIYDFKTKYKIHN